MKKDLAMVFGITKDLDLALANVLISMKEHGNMPKNMDIYVFHDGLSQEKEDVLNSILPCEFIEYHNDISEGTLDSTYLKLYSIS